MIASGMSAMHGATGPAWPWVTLLLLGAFHGANPAMGWLFATALGLQERRASGVLRALPPIAVGHAASVAAVLVAAGALALVIPQFALRIVAAAVLFAFAAYKIATRFRHPTWVGMRVGPRDLTVWSFLMASAHGAGLMLLPVLLRTSATLPSHVTAESHMSMLPAPPSAGAAVAAVAVHTVGVFTVMAAIALIAYRAAGVGILRRAWINLDIVWAAALIAAGVATLAIG
jgi:hypothetical protein